MIYVISDIHGNKDAFNKIKEKIHFSKDDEMWILGDVIDRMPHGISILKEIMNTPNIHMLMGNHELMMLDAYDHMRYAQYDAIELWFNNGGIPTCNAFMKENLDTRLSMISFLEHLPLKVKINVGDKICTLVHAGIPDMFTEGSQSEQLTYTVWDRELIKTAWEELGMKDNEYIIHGHTPTHDTIVGPDDLMSIKYESRHCINIDCGAPYGSKYGGRLACVCLDNMEVIYSE